MWVVRRAGQLDLATSGTLLANFVLTCRQGHDGKDMLFPALGVGLLGFKVSYYSPAETTETPWNAQLHRLP